ncbi:uncharacterized protein UMAG_05548 [Mycosarcoma maydis]|uniref:laccase n=1 Tax=Mycosarcoma maydis TaxID=5270 RepID=A0A0D1BXC0_MYCMD|nr:uncharacterized protein UMAG_05548 [Ustilago maydis 521]KIS66557.1 hypothetical protein UMAG_05548 [Ustilago maydis 521]|eukprot:XP_011391860.1 hypothetical protein UMAG_05548 [Ustilago maydis 521]
MILSKLGFALVRLISVLILCTCSHALPSSSSIPATRRLAPRRVTVRHYTLNVTTATLFSACDPFGPTTLIDSSFPGRVLRARAGEILSVRVYNHLDANGESGGNLTMHFHGLSMRMHPVMDGTMLVSQWPITPGKFFDYRIPLTAEDKGTYYYHSHVGVQSMTAYGALVVEDPEEQELWDPSQATLLKSKHAESVEFVHVYGEEALHKNGKSGQNSPYSYDQDRVLAIGDWFSYSSVKQVQKQLLADPFVWPGSATKLLVNGKSSPVNISALSAPACNQTKADAIGVKCTSAPAQCARPVYPTIELDYDKTYRFRLVGATSLMYVSLGILKPTKTAYTSINATSSVVAQPVQFDKMTLIEADGSYLDRLDVDHIELTSGQRYSVLYKSLSRKQVKQDGTGGVYWMRLESRWRAGPSMWLKIVYPSHNTSAVQPPIRLASGQKDLQLLPAETFGWKTSQLSPLSKPYGPHWWYSDRMPSDSEVTRTVLIDTQQVKFFASGKGVKWDQNGVALNETSPGTRTPYLVRTFLGDIQLPTATQIESAMYNPVSYKYRDSNGNDTGTSRMMIDMNNATEVEAASRRHWGQAYSSKLNMYFGGAGEVIDIVLVNQASQLSSSVEIHPWHMHSHKHFTRTIQAGTFSFSRLASLYASSSSSKAFSNPIQRDTTVAYASPGAAFLNQTIPNPQVDHGGWTVLRYKVDPKNAGVFLLHCHIAFHLEMGMATVWTMAPDQLARTARFNWPTLHSDHPNIQGLNADRYLHYANNVNAVL